MTTTEDAGAALDGEMAATRLEMYELDDSAVACLNAGIPCWWVHGHEDGCGGAEWYAVLRADPRDETSEVLGSVRCADYDAMIAECVRRNRAAGEGGQEA